MSSDAPPKQKTRLAVSAEARQLLARMAEQSGVTPSAVLEQAIREKAQRESMMPANGSLVKVTPEEEAAAWERLRQLIEQARAGAELPPEEIQRQVAIIRAASTVTPPK